MVQNREGACAGEGHGQKCGVWRIFARRESALVVGWNDADWVPSFSRERGRGFAYQGFEKRRSSPVVSGSD
jgi:hypothetical protein